MLFTIRQWLSCSEIWGNSFHHLDARNEKSLDVFLLFLFHVPATNLHVTKRLEVLNVIYYYPSIHVFIQNLYFISICTCCWSWRQFRQKDKFTYTFPSMGNLKWPVDLICMPSDCQRKPECSEETHTTIGRTCKRWKDRPEPFSCEATQLSTAPQYINTLLQKILTVGKLKWYKKHNHTYTDSQGLFFYNSMPRHGLFIIVVFLFWVTNMHEQTVVMILHFDQRSKYKLKLRMI